MVSEDLSELEKKLEGAYNTTTKMKEWYLNMEKYYLDMEKKLEGAYNTTTKMKEWYLNMEKYYLDMEKREKAI